MIDKHYQQQYEARRELLARRKSKMYKTVKEVFENE